MLLLGVPSCDVTQSVSCHGPSQALRWQKQARSCHYRARARRVCVCVSMLCGQPRQPCPCECCPPLARALARPLKGHEAASGQKILLAIGCGIPACSPPKLLYFNHEVINSGRALLAFVIAKILALCKRRRRVCLLAKSASLHYRVIGPSRRVAKNRIWLRRPRQNDETREERRRQFAKAIGIRGGVYRGGQLVLVLNRLFPAWVKDGQQLVPADGAWLGQISGFLLDT